MRTGKLQEEKRRVPEPREGRPPSSSQGPKPRTRREFLSAALLGAAGVALTGGCSIDGILPEPFSSLASGSGKSAIDSAVSQAQVTRVLDGGTLVCQTAGIAALHPHGVWGYWERVACRCVFDPLTEYDFAQKKLVGKAATSWEADASMRRFLFHLREGVTFHNGETVTAQNFAMAWNALAAAQDEAGMRLASCLSMVGGFARVSQGEEGPELDLECPDDYTLVVNLDHPFADFPYIASMPQLAALPGMAFEPGGRFARRPSGNGAFCLSEDLGAGKAVRLAANTTYWGSEPHVDAVEFRESDDFEGDCSGLVGGPYDLVYVPVEQAAQMEQAFGGPAQDGTLNPGNQTCASGLSVVSMLVANCASQALSDAAARRAVAWAIDAVKLARKVGLDASAAADSPFVPTSLAYEAQMWASGIDGTACAQTVADTWPGADGSASLVLLCDPCVLAELGSAVAAQLKGVGIPATLATPAWSEYAARLRSGDFDLAIVAHRPRSDAAAMELFSLFYSQGDQNFSRYASDEVDEALVQACQIGDEASRLDALHGVARTIAQDSPVIPLLYAAGGVATSDRVNALSVGADLFPAFASCWLSA